MALSITIAAAIATSHIASRAAPPVSSQGAARGIMQMMVAQNPRSCPETRPPARTRSGAKTAGTPSSTRTARMRAAIISITPVDGLAAERVEQAKYRIV